MELEKPEDTNDEELRSLTQKNAFSINHALLTFFGVTVGAFGMLVLH